MEARTLREVLFGLHNCGAILERCMFDDVTCEEQLLLEQARVHILNARKVIEIVLIPADEPHDRLLCECSECENSRAAERSHADTLRPLTEGQANEPPATVDADARGTEQATARKPYSPPTLAYLGRFRDLTHGGNTSPAADMGGTRKPGQ